MLYLFKKEIMKEIMIVSLSLFQASSLTSGRVHKTGLPWSFRNTLTVTIALRPLVTDFMRLITDHHERAVGKELLLGSIGVKIGSITAVIRPLATMRVRCI